MGNFILQEFVLVTTTLHEFYFASLPDIFLKLRLQNKPRAQLFVVVPGICLF